MPVPALKIRFWDEGYPRPNFIEWAVTKNLPLLPADEANREVVRLTVELMRLQAKLDAKEIKP